MAKVGKHRGTIVHNYCENLWSNKIFPIYHPNWIMRLPTEETITYIRSVNKCIEMANGFFEGYRERFIPVKLEFVLGDEDAKIISMIDLLAYDIVKDCLVILDYKTDKRFNKTSPFGNKFLEPISHLDDCEFNKYSLQLSLYKYIIEKNSNLKIEDMYVVWMFHKNDTYKVIEIPYMEKELKLMLECHD